MQHLQRIPAKAETHLSARPMFPSWHNLLRALRKGLCLADPWVPAFAGMDAAMDER
jgi:hypothetical protein